MALRKRRATPRRRAAPRWTAEDWANANPLLMARSNGCCEHCGRPLNGRVERHHRQRRQVGGDRLSNILMLLPEHHAYLTEHPEEARANGWVVSSHGPDGAPDPATVPVRLPDGYLWLLDDAGGKRPVS